jgi:hypothetical protein
MKKLLWEGPVSWFSGDVVQDFDGFGRCYRSETGLAFEIKDGDKWVDLNDWVTEYLKFGVQHRDHAYAEVALNICVDMILSNISKF